MRVVFFGTPAFAVPSLDALLAAGIEIPAVITQPDRARGRSHSTLVPPPVKTRALEAGIQVLQPERPSGDVLMATLKHLEADLGVVVAYGHLLRPEFIEIPALGMVNVHASLLPRWRGAAPVQWSIMSGDKETGISIMRVERGLDSGGVWLTQRVPIEHDDTAATLTSRLSNIGAVALIEALPRITNGVHPALQAESGITLAPKIDRNVARISWTDDATVIAAKIRAMDPAPGAWCTLGETEVKFFSPMLPDTSVPGLRPGEIIADGEHLLIATSNGAVMIREVQPAGRRRMPAADWLRGGAIAAGARFT